MKLAYVTAYDAADVHAWSGSGSHILRALRESGFKTEPIGSLREAALPRWSGRLKRVCYSRLFSKNYLRDREPAILKGYARQVEGRLASSPCDVVFSPGTPCVAYLRTDRPIVFWTDATFAGMQGFYPDFRNLCAETIRHGNRIDQMALSKCRFAIYSSEWAARTAVDHYDVDPSKVRVIPFGANVECDREEGDIARIVQAKEFHRCKLLFLGVDWYRKGGDAAVAVAELLTRHGLPTELHVVGCEPPPSVPGFVVRHGFVSKRTEEGRRRLEQLFREAHFLILPSRADCVPVVFAEASSFGLPCLATDVGGIGTAIRCGANGWTFALSDGPERYTEQIERFMASRGEYLQLALSSFREYSTRLNWTAAAASVGELLRGIRA